MSLYHYISMLLHRTGAKNMGQENEKAYITLKCSALENVLSQALQPSFLIPDDIGAVIVIFEKWHVGASSS